MAKTHSGLPDDGMENNRMKLRSTTACAALVIGAMTMGMTIAHADDAPAKPAGIDYSTKLADGNKIVTTLKNGTFELAQQDGATPEDPKQTLVNVKDQQGAVLLSFPLKYSVSGKDIAVKSELKDDGKVLEVVPEKPADFQPGTEPVVAQVQPAGQLKDIASDAENQKAMNDFSTKFSLAIGIGSFVGTALGAIIGCVVTFVAGCVPGLVAGAGIGGILGTIAAGGPTLAAAGFDLINTLQAPAGTTRWSDAAQAQQQAAAQQPVNQN
ncbi:hypothetical protein VMT65_36245 [Nocardia sp. CDC153]|uniref:hypothetical protein n=1 Tax=Nocardia sp. CDC153 TaxID=3112167 RepID=UPI002DBF0A61|nr:hypothetical protein [Nocardia sp. CDC153]MEC3958533.1 hypothetical protein [Nocardia sp. CDC153]